MSAPEPSSTPPEPEENEPLPAAWTIGKSPWTRFRERARGNWPLQIGLGLLSGYLLVGVAALVRYGSSLQSLPSVQAFVAQHVIATVSVDYSHATTSTLLDDQYGLKSDRTDVMGGFDWLVRPTVTLYATAGRTIGTLDSTGTTLIGVVGVSVRMSGRATKP